MKRIVIYKSFLGATKQYAEWLAKDLKMDIDGYGIRDDKLSLYDTVVVMSGTYAGFMPLVGFLKKKWPLLKGKTVIAAGVGGVAANDPASILAYEKIPEDIRKGINYLKIMGRMGKQPLKKENLKPVIDAINERRK